MHSVTTQQFRKAFDQLPKQTQSQARQVYHFWLDNPRHPSLHFKQIHSTKPIYSVRIGLGIRALAIKEGNTMIWFWIGSHSDYNKLVRQLWSVYCHHYRLGHHMTIPSVSQHAWTKPIPKHHCIHQLPWTLATWIIYTQDWFEAKPDQTWRALRWHYNSDFEGVDIAGLVAVPTGF